ncbi:MAG: CDP-alcohol phosphatidyltransferase family protein [Proteobacteria bacterium]|nr:CDP-alcohol phosphatidyltransferase family protein [Pseudomonadota bacterium]
MQKHLKSMINNIALRYKSSQFCLQSRCVRQKWQSHIDVWGRKAAEYNISANLVSLLGFAIGMLSINFLAMNMYFWALVCILLNRAFDALDGSIAKFGKPSDFGVFLDAALDYIFYAGVIFGFALANPWENAVAASFLLFGFSASASAMLAYAVIAYKNRRRVEPDLEQSPFYLGGLAQGFETLAALVILCIVPVWFLPIAIILGCWCLVKALMIVSAAYFNFVIARKEN